MTGDPAVLEVMLAMLAAEAHLNLQYRSDWRTLKFIGVDKIAGKVKGLGTKAHRAMKILADRILALGGETSYDVAPIAFDSETVAIFEGELKLENALVTLGRQAIKTAVGAGDEATAEKLRHIEERHEDAVEWLEQQLRLQDADTYELVNL